MAFDYSEMVAIATELITEFGREIDIIKIVRVPADEDKPWREPLDADDEASGDETYDSITVMGVLVNKSSDFDFGFQTFDEPGDLTRVANKKFLVDAATVGDVALEDYDEIQDGDDVWKIIRVNVLQPGDTRLLYELEVIQ